jgi:hypothetical protein
MPPPKPNIFGVRPIALFMLRAAKPTLSRSRKLTKYNSITNGRIRLHHTGTDFGDDIGDFSDFVPNLGQRRCLRRDGLFASLCHADSVPEQRAA